MWRKQASIDCYYWTVTFCHQVGSAYKTCNRHLQTQKASILPKGELTVHVKVLFLILCLRKAFQVLKVHQSINQSIKGGIWNYSYKRKLHFFLDKIENVWGSKNDSNPAKIQTCFIQLKHCNMNVPAIHRLKILPCIIYLRCIKAPSRALCRCPFMCVMGVEHLHCEQIWALNSWEMNGMIGAIISASVYQTGNPRPTGKSLSNSITFLQTHYTHTPVSTDVIAIVI